MKGGTWFNRSIFPNLRGYLFEDYFSLSVRIDMILCVYCMHMTKKQTRLKLQVISMVAVRYQNILSKAIKISLRYTQLH